MRKVKPRGRATSIYAKQLFLSVRLSKPGKLIFHMLPCGTPEILNSFCIIDGRTVWYSSGELFGKQEDECVLRIEDEVLAGELSDIVERIKF